MLAHASDAYFTGILSIPVASPFFSSETAFSNSSHNISGPMLSLPTFTDSVWSLDGLINGLI